jgi:hypothetical protein
MAKRIGFSLRRTPKRAVVVNAIRIRYGWIKQSVSHGTGRLSPGLGMISGIGIA